MPDIDKVLEAEAAIGQIADELKKMKGAADLLETAQEKVDIILESNEKITQSVDSFVQSSKYILDRIKEIDFNTELNKLEENVSGKIDSGNDSLLSIIEDEHNKVSNNLTKSNKEIKASIESRFNHLLKYRLYIYFIIALNVAILVTIILR